MIKHIVMWNLKKENKEENSKKIKEMLEGLNGIIKEANKLEVGININDTNAAMDIVLYSEFNTIEDLDSYQKNPHHLKVAEFVKTVAIDRKVVDFNA